MTCKCGGRQIARGMAHSIRAIMTLPSSGPTSLQRYRQSTWFVRTTSLELLQHEVEDVFLLTKHVRLQEALGFFQQGLLVDEVAADHAVLWIPDHASETARKSR